MNRQVYRDRLLLQVHSSGDAEAQSRTLFLRQDHKVNILFILNNAFRQWLDSFSKSKNYSSVVNINKGNCDSHGVCVRDHITVVIKLLVFLQETFDHAESRRRI